MSHIRVPCWTIGTPPGPRAESVNPCSPGGELSPLADSISIHTSFHCHYLLIKITHQVTDEKSAQILNTKKILHRQKCTSVSLHKEN